MRERLKVWSTVVFGLLVAAALAFGAQTALAELPTASCFFSPPDQVGACTDNNHCQQLCDMYSPPGSRMGVCNGMGCCHCYL